MQVHQRQEALPTRQNTLTNKKSGTETHIQIHMHKADITTTLTHNCSNKGRHNALSPIEEGFVYAPRKYKYVTTALLYIKAKKLINRLANTKKVVTLQCKNKYWDMV